MKQEHTTRKVRDMGSRKEILLRTPIADKQQKMAKKIDDDRATPPASNTPENSHIKSD
jgi:hypothetical protein